MYQSTRISARQQALFYSWGGGGGGGGGGGVSGTGLEMPGMELVNPGLLGLHHICLERGRDRKTNTCRDFDRQTDRQRNAIDTI